LAFFLKATGAHDESPERNWRFSRLADAMVQRARKDGFIYADKRRWLLKSRDKKEDVK
jgi:hypothetical protein